jgi:hypothetical protein
MGKKDPLFETINPQKLFLYLMWFQLLIYFEFDRYICNMGIWRQIGQYLWIVKKDPDTNYSKMTRAMHFINRLSILLFILVMIILIIQLVRR